MLDGMGPFLHSEPIAQQVNLFSLLFDKSRKRLITAYLASDGQI